MARTVKAAQTVRREAFVEAATRLIQTKGYEQMSVQDVLDELGASKGSFYHYFDSKRALLVAVSERMTEAAVAALAPVLEDPSRTALHKLQAVFTGLAAYTGESQDLVLAVLETWRSDDNAIVREQVRRSGTRRLRPVLAAIVAQGVAEDVFAAVEPQETAIVMASMLYGFQETGTELFFARRRGEVSFDAVLRANAADLAALERLLGLPAESLEGHDEATLRLWFDG
ncbi:TetR/AcrR family transcriptional regulator [Nocardia mexicana]|uniref:TetR family transcriptional regulator n=1 Tax=Nocardia mexicana TaxID=279262 RepID=A0A370HDR8_9NOCA|nr:TetR/AcrR family transcriptional regulator [Nocardia mexicana]RDI55368.1 TetR family transcriptional regulator [Nocardia mexicana]